MAATPTAATLQDRLLAELIRRREEATGHPADSPEADAAARAAGGTLERRILHRAARHPDAPALRRGLRQAGRILLGGSLLLAALFALAGAGAAAAALGGEPVSLPLALALLVGPNLALLGVWLLWTLLFRHLPLGVPRLIAEMMSRWPGARQASATSEALRLLLLGPGGRWIAAVVVHAAWVAFSVAALVGLLLLLSLRSHALSWETTLLDETALTAWAQALSTGPALLGLAGAETLPLRAPMPAAANEAWAAWLIAAVFCYGLLPRLLALAAAAALAWHATRTVTRALHQPGYARLRRRLMPAHGPAQPVDAVPETALPVAATVRPPTPASHGASLELPVALTPPVDWRWLGDIDDADSRRRVCARLAEERVEGLALVVRAAAVADRGSAHAIATLRDAADAPVSILLHGAASAERLRDWRALAGTLDVALGQWDENRARSA